MVEPADVEPNQALKNQLTLRAKELGFHRVGVARVEPLEPEGARLRAFVKAGRHGSMGWLADTVDVRADVRHEGMLPSAESVVVLAMSYARAEPSVEEGVAQVARYARGRDYHNVIGKRARKLAKLIRQHGYDARVSVDSVPVYERAWAARAGVGFIGKNCCLIVPGLGSHVFLATLVTSALLPADEPIKEGCGSCTLCLDACPTDAFVGPRQLDGSACISYLTIEKRDAIAEPHRTQLGARLFGCDVCQDVCPYNRTRPVPEIETEPFAQRALPTPEELLQIDDATFRQRLEGSPLKRPGREGMARNAAYVLGNTKSKRALPVLRSAATEDSSEVVRDAAKWALAKILTAPDD